MIKIKMTIGANTLELDADSSEAVQRVVEKFASMVTNEPEVQRRIDQAAVGLKTSTDKVEEKIADNPVGGT